MVVGTNTVLTDGPSDQQPGWCEHTCVMAANRAEIDPVL